MYHYNEFLLGRVRKREPSHLRHNVGHVIDLVPTILAATGGQPFKQWEGQPVPPAPGKSLLPVLAKDYTVERDYLWWFHKGNRAIRIGEWKLVSGGAKGPWELYNMSVDSTETMNLAERYPEKVEQLKKAWNQRMEEFRKVATRDLVEK